jgi:hypothetical protein
MGDFFSPDVSQEPMVSGYQMAIQRMIAQGLPGLMQGGKALMGGREKMLRQLLQPYGKQFEPIEQAAYRRHSEFSQPAIDEGFAAHGSAMSTRRGDISEQSVSDLETNLAALETQSRQGWEALRLNAGQQILSERLAPFGLGGSFSTAVSQENIVQPSWGSQLLGVGGQLGSAALMGGAGSMGAGAKK